jgi:hypothetical protein
MKIKCKNPEIGKSLVHSTNVDCRELFEHRDITDGVKYQYKVGELRQVAGPCRGFGHSQAVGFVLIS